MKTINFIVLLFTSFLLLASSCRKESSCERVYMFEFQTNLYPVQDTFQTGDTIWVEFNYKTDSLIDLNTNSIVVTDSFDFNLYALIAKYDSSIVEDGIDFFSYGAEIGNIQRVDLATISNLNFTFKKNNKSNNLKFFIIPESSGYYQIGFSSVFIVRDQVEFIDSNCEEYLNIEIKTNDGVGNNFNHYKENSPDEDVTLQGYNRIGLYSFVVFE